MNKRTIAALITGLTVISAPFAHLEENELLVARAYAETTDQLPRLLKEAYQSFIQDRTLGKQQMEALLPHKEQLLPILQAGIALSQERQKLTAGQADNIYHEWSFWLEVARQLNDPRIEPALLSWLTEQRPIPDHYLLGEVLDQLIKPSPGNDDKLLQALAKASPAGSSVILSLLEKRKRLDDQQLNSLLETYADQPQAEAIIGIIGSRENGTDRLQHLYDASSLSTETKRKIIGQILMSVDGKELSWLKQVARVTTDPATGQMIDRVLVRNHGDQEAARRLHESGMKHGFLTALDGLTEKFIAELLPTGKLSQGIAAYEKIRGFPYFHQLDGDQWFAYQSRGKDFAQPEAAVKQWLNFIETYPNHPALDDAAYRLARCYQILGENERALYWFEQTQNIGDKDLQYDASGQFMFVLDVNMEAKELASLDTSQLPAWTKGWAAYSLAVEYMRERDYHKASAALQEFIDTYEKKDPQSLTQQQDHLLFWQSYYPFWNHVREQLSLAKELAQMNEAANQAAGAEKAKRQYELAAKISKNPLLYYNHLWRGERQGFFWLGQIKSMDYHAKLDQYIARFNHLVQAADLFSQVNLDEADQETGAKTLFSLMLMHSKLIEYGDEVAFHMPKSMLGQRILQYGEQLLKRYPQSELADDAMLLIFYYTNDMRKLKDLLARYPQGDKAAEAQKILQERMSGPQEQYRYNPLETAIPVQKLDENDWQLSANIKKWVDQHKGKPGRYIQLDGDWLYAYMVPEPGKEAYVYLQTNLTSAAFHYQEYSVQNRPANKEPGVVLLRVPYRFVQHAKVIWQPIGN